MMGVALILIVLFASLSRNTSSRVQATYSPRLAWLRGGIYFCTCFLISWQTGVFHVLLRAPLATEDNLQDPAWVAMTAACVVVILIGYGYVWPRGTLAHGRPLRLASVLIFGLLWGFSEAQLFLSFWALAELSGLATVYIALITFVAITAFNGPWHAFYWDIHVAPEHNIVEWNVRKVAFAHTPNLIFTLTYLALYGNVVIFVLLQTFALTASTYFMRFPSPSDPDEGGDAGGV